MIPNFVNIHTHQSGEGINLLDVSRELWVLDKQHILLFTMGIHPMYIPENIEVELLMLQQKICDKRIVALGESGLDRNSVTPAEEQINWFVRQISLSERYGIPLIIHCVKAFPELISLHKKYQPEQPWIIHGFNNNRAILLELLRYGFYISAGKNVMNEKSNIFQLLPEIPLDRLFLETDDSVYKIQEIYHQVAGRLQIEPEKLKNIIYDNFVRLFHITIICFLFAVCNPHSIIIFFGVLSGMEGRV